MISKPTSDKYGVLYLVIMNTCTYKVQPVHRGTAILTLLDLLRACASMAVDKWVLGGAEAPPSSNKLIKSYIFILQLSRDLHWGGWQKAYNGCRFHRQPSVKRVLPYINSSCVHTSPTIISRGEVAMNNLYVTPMLQSTPQHKYLSTALASDAWYRWVDPLLFYLRAWGRC